MVKQRLQKNEAALTKGQGRCPLIAGNWKMNGLRAVGIDLARAVGGGPWPGEVEVLVCPPATLVAAVAEAVAGTGLAVGGQDCHPAESGAHTGDISAGMLADAGASHVILGHSERRQNHGEADALVKAKCEAAWGHGLIAIICIGETEAERDSGQALAVLSTQLEGSVPATATGANTVIAYEPVWAIGTGRTAEPPQVGEAHSHIRTYLGTLVADAAADIRILYGGSVKPANARELLSVGDVDGALVGGASLKAADFLAIAAAAGPA